MLDTYEQFTQAIYRLTGINLASYKERQMKRRIDSLILKRNFSDYDGYVAGLRTDKELYDEFLNYITINVSEFYRNPKQWEVLEKEIIPMLLKEKSTLKIWSAACSTGEEPYSLVFAMNRFIPLEQIKIIATDIDKEVILKAKEGIYNPKSLESLPDDLKNKHFTQEGDFYRVKSDVKQCVEFQRHNLLEDKYIDNCDLIVCRNVLIYFTEGAKSQVYTGFSRSLRQNGILFVGSTEQIILPSRYGYESQNTFFYEKVKAV